MTRLLITAFLPFIAALILSGFVLWLLGTNPFAYYDIVLQRGLFSAGGVQASATHMAAPLLIGASLIVAFRAGLWNLGGDGQFLLAAVVVAAAAPPLAGILPHWVALACCLALGAAVGAAWSVLPAFLKAYQGVNEIITTLMMTFLGVSLANVLIKLVFADPHTTVPQTRTLPVADRLPHVFHTTVSSGLLIGIVTIIFVQLVMTRTAFGLRLRMVGASPKAALHAGLPVSRLIFSVFGLSAALAGLAGAVDILGVQGNVRADWNPAYTLSVVPLVFLARLNGLAAIPLMFLFAILSIGGESAARRLGVPNQFTLVVMATLLILLGLSETMDRRRRTEGRG